MDKARYDLRNAIELVFIIFPSITIAMTAVRLSPDAAALGCNASVHAIRLRSNCFSCNPFRFRCSERYPNAGIPKITPAFKAEYEFVLLFSSIQGRAASARARNRCRDQDLMGEIRIGRFSTCRAGEIMLFIAAALTVLWVLDCLRPAWPVLRRGG